MTVNRINRKTSHYSTILNEGAHDKDLSWQARGMLWYLLTKPDGWEVMTKDLEKQSKGQGKKAVASILKDLEINGYLIRWCEHGDRGCLVWRSEIFESQQATRDWVEENQSLLESAIRVPSGTLKSLSAIHPLSINGETSAIHPSREDALREDALREDAQGRYILSTELINNGIDQKLIEEQELTKLSALSQETLSELEENSTQDQPIADQSASLLKKQRDSADDGETSSETGYSAAQTFPQQKNNATANYEKRFASPHKYPELIEAGYGEIMIGKGYLDFDPIVVEAAVRHLKKHELACEVGDGKRFISNRIKEADWAAIELLKEAAAALVCDRKKTEAAISASTNSDEYYDTSRYYVPEPPQIDVEARREAAESGIAKMKAALAEARKKTGILNRS